MTTGFFFSQSAVSSDGLLTDRRVSCRVCPQKGRDVVYFQSSLHDNLIVQRFLGLIIKSMAVQIRSILCVDFNNAFESVSRHRSREKWTSKC